MQQEQALEILKSGENVFLTGAAGTGKTYVLKQFIEYLKSEEIPYAITASTGIAATHLNGVTVHSWSGIGIRNNITEQDIKNLNRNIRYNYLNTQVLIIDEISMLHGHQLDMIEQIASAIRQASPFGGIQVVVCGDFCQLPPVANENEDIVFAYESNAWVYGDFKVCYLDKQYRQNDGDDLLNILNAIRESKVTPKVKSRLEDFSQTAKSEQITKLYTNNVDVDRINTFKLAKIEGETYRFRMQEFGNNFAVANLKKRCLAKEILELKVGAFVIFIQNDREKRYVNGTSGVVTGFTSSKQPIVTTRDGDVIYVTNGEWKVEDSEGRPIAYITQIPLCLAWAITIHKSQGMTLDAAEIDLTKAFCFGMGYVALSRVRDSKGLRLLGFNEKSLQIDPKILEQDKVFKGESK